MTIKVKFVIALTLTLILLNNGVQTPDIAAQGNVYYVDVNHAQASDEPDHGSENSPWKSLDYAFFQLHPGDTLLIRSGTYTNGQIVLTPDQSGLPDAPVTIRAFPNETVILAGGDQITFQGTDWWVLDGLIFDAYRSQALQIGTHTKLGHSRTSVVENVTIRNSEFRNGIYSAISLDNVVNILIDNCYFHHIRPGTSFYNNSGKQVGWELNAVGIRYLAANVTVSNSRFEDIGSDGVQIGSKSSISGSVIDNTAILNSEFWVNRPYEGILGNVGENGIDVKTSTNTLIAGNRIYGFRPTTAQQDASGSNGEGVVIHNNAQDAIVERNLFFNNTINLDISGGATGDQANTQNFIVRNNIIRNAQPSDGREGFGLKVAEVRNVAVYHNTFYQNDVTLRSYQVTGGSFKNNIIYKGEIAVNTDNTDWDAAANAWSNIKGSLPKQLKSGDTIYPDNLQLNDDLSLSANSPGQNQGRLVGVEDDYEGKPRNDGSPDLGAFEFGGLLVTPTSQAIDPGQSAQFMIYLSGASDNNEVLDLIIGDFSTEIVVTTSSNKLNVNEPTYVTIADRHPLGTIVQPGIWYTIPVKITGANFSQDVQLRVLVGGSRVFMPTIIRSTE